MEEVSTFADFKINFNGCGLSKKQNTMKFKNLQL